MSDPGDPGRAAEGMALGGGGLWSGALCCGVSLSSLGSSIFDNPPMVLGIGGAGPGGGWCGSGRWGGSGSWGGGGVSGSGGDAGSGFVVASWNSVRLTASV